MPFIVVIDRRFGLFMTESAAQEFTLWGLAPIHLSHLKVLRYLRFQLVASRDGQSCKMASLFSSTDSWYFCKYRVQCQK